jgi:glycosyltransferase involved in cell wall biosynthesis
MPNISVIIPAYNRGHLIAETLRSLLAQTLPAEEIIVVDDGSTDNTVAVAESFGPPVKVVCRSNGGPAAARNTGFACAKGEFIHFFDSDDLAAANKHEVQVGALERTGADIAISPWIQGKFVGNQFRADGLAFQQPGLPAEKDLVKALLTYWGILPHTLMFRRGMVEKSGGFDESLFGPEDQQMFLACLLAGARVVHAPGTMMFYRQGDAGKITENQAWAVRRLREWGRFLLKARELCRQEGIEPLNWFGYRRRLWEAGQDLSCAGQADEPLMTGLHIWADTRTPSAVYRWHRTLERWQSSLQQRLIGGRAHHYFRIGSISAGQIKSLAQLGYEYRPPQRLPWWPQRVMPGLSVLQE